MEADILKKFQNVQQETLDALNQENRFLKKMLDVINLMGTTELEVSLEYILKAIVEVTKARRGMIILCDEKYPGKYHILISTGNKIEEQDSVNFCTGIAVNAISSGQTIVIDNVIEDSKYKSNASVIALNLKAIICIPLIVKKKTFGVLYLDSDQSSHSFSKKKAGLFESLTKQVAQSIDNVKIINTLKRDNVLLKKELRGEFRFGNIVYTSKKMENVIQFIKKVLDNSVSIIITGESGSGKELIAHAIHYNSIRKEGHFIAQNCGALSETLLESELFGYKKGSFTGATSDRTGLFEAADGGTIFLDEIGEISPNVQVKLLRVLESHTIRRIGDTRERAINIRIIAATNRNLKQLVEEGKFREDLYYRLNVFPIQIPALRERPEDIPVLVNYFLGLLNKELNRNITSVSKELLGHLMQKKWAGNIRELKNYLYRLVILCQGSTLTLQDIPDTEPEPLPPRHNAGKGIKSLATIEKEYIQYALECCNYNKSLAARKLGLNRSTLMFKINKLGVSLPGEGN